MDEIRNNSSGVPSEPFAVLKNFVQQYRIPLVILIGLLTPFARYALDRLLFPASGMSQSLTMTISIVQVSLQKIALLGLCWPWTDYVVPRRVALTWAIAIFFGGSINLVLRWWGFVARMIPWGFPVVPLIGGLAFGLVAWVLLSYATFVRMRYWPLYPPGHCVQCGYDLTGNVSGRCPECGTDLVPSVNQTADD